jgi:hypothetical protein
MATWTLTDVVEQPCYMEIGVHTQAMCALKTDKSGAYTEGDQLLQKVRAHLLQRWPPQ